MAVVRLRLLVATAVVVVVEKETLAAAVVVVAAAVVADVRWGDDSFGLAAAVATNSWCTTVAYCGCFGTFQPSAGSSCCTLYWPITGGTVWPTARSTAQ